MSYAYRSAPISPSSRGGSTSLANFNEHAPECTINSPRSLAAMKRLGISGAEIQFRPPTHRSFTEGVDQATADALPDYSHRRFQHYEQKRQAKVRALREERDNMIAYGEGGTMVLHSNSHHGADSQLVTAARDRACTALDMEREEIARMQQRLLTKLNNTLAFEIRRAQTLDRAQTKVDYANARAQAEKDYRAQVQAERDEQQKQHVIETQRRLAEEAEIRRQQADEAWRQTQAEKREKMEYEAERRRAERAAQVDHRNRTEEKRQQLEAIQEMQRRVIAEKEARLAEKEAERIRNTEAARRRLQEFNEANQRAAREKLELAAARSQQQLEDKRLRFLDKEALAEEKRRQFEDAREYERQQARERARRKEAAIKQAQQQADRIIQYKAEVTLAKEQSTADRLAERDRIRQSDEHERKMWQQDRDAHRKAILEQSYWMREERGQQILAKRAELNARSNEAMRQRHAEMTERKLQERLLESDRKEQVARMARIQANQREELLQRIQSDRDRIDTLQQQSHALAQQRLKLRDLADKQQAMLLDQFERLKADPEKLRNLDPNNVDVVKMGFLDQRDMAQLLSFNKSPTHSRSRSSSVTPSRGSSSGVRRAASARRQRSIDQSPIMDRPLPRPQTQQNGRRNQSTSSAYEDMEYQTRMMTH